MIAPRWRKVARDVLGRPGRSLLAMTAMAAGLLEICAMLYQYAKLRPELTSFYARTHPAAATLLTDAAGDDVVDLVRHVPGVGDAEARPVVFARARHGDAEWTPSVIAVLRDFDRQKLDLVKPDQGAWPPGPDDLLLERTALRVAGVAIGDSLDVRLPNGDERRLRVAGTVHAAGLAPAWMEHMVPAFVAWESPLRGEEHGESAQIRIGVSDHPLDEGHIREVADSVRAALERAGHPVARVTVPAPGRHPHADQMEAFLFLLLSFGVLSFALSTLLVAGMIQALMAEQVREVGVMHAMGATARQIAGIYLAEVGLLAAGALAIGIPLGLAIGDAYTKFAAGVLNADLTHRPFPLGVVLAEIVAGIVVPLLVALGPVRRAARLSVREALSDDAAPSTAAASVRGAALLARLPRPLSLPFRAVLDRPGRLTFTLLMLAVGGATFMAALNVADAWTRSVNRDFAGRGYDLLVAFTETQPLPDVERVIAGCPTIARAEFWAGASPYVLGADGVPGGAATLAGPPAGTRLLAPRLAAGRFLAPGDSGVAVVNRALLRLRPGLRPGDTLGLRLAGRTVRLAVVGVTAEMVPMPLVYAPRPAVLAFTGRDGDATKSVHLVTRARGPAAERAAAAEVEAAFRGAGIEVAALQRTGDAKQGILDHLVIIFSILTLASAVVVFVAALALASTLTLRVIQRTREIGVLGAIGARPLAIAGHIGLEALTIALAGWVLGLLLTLPVSAALEAATGNIFFKAPLDFSISPAAAGIWLVVLLALAALGSLYPVTRAVRLTIREALAHA